MQAGEVRKKDMKARKKESASGNRSIGFAQMNRRRDGEVRSGEEKRG